MSPGGKRSLVIGAVLLGVALLVGALVLYNRRPAEGLLSASNVRQLIIAMHKYHSDHKTLPPAMTMKEDKPLHSWRVLILPYIDGGNLAKQLKMDEPWNSPDNLKILESMPMPEFFHHPADKDGASKKTYYKVFTSKPGIKPSAGFQPEKGFNLGYLELQDGTRETVAIVESGPPVLWYQPEDIDFDPKGAFPKLESPWPDNRVQVGFIDATVRGLWLGQHEDIWKAIVTRNGGEKADVMKLSEIQK